MNWASRRKIIYASAAVLFLLTFAVYQLRSVLFPTPTCFDEKKNGYESGVDCGGMCALRCTEEVSPLTVEWTRAIKSSEATYDLVGMVSNKNLNSAPQVLGYVFTVLDAQGKSLGTYTASSTVLVSGSFPVMVQGVSLPRPPSAVILRLMPTPWYATFENPVLPPVRTSDFYYEGGDISRISVIVKNTTRTVYLKLPIRLIAYDDKDNVVAAGESVLPELSKEESREVVFTWHQPLSATPVKFRAYVMTDPAK